MKLFTLEEANKLIPSVRPLLLDIQRRHAEVSAMRESAKKAADSAGHGGGMEGGTGYVHCLFELGRLSTELDALGIQLKDYSRGLIDFPSMRDEQIILLCWQLGEGDEIEWWHDMESGFAGRQRI